MSLSPAEGSRRRQPKSKTGCRTCKRRKVKCDEGRPACRNCVKHGVECDFIAPVEVQTPASRSPSQLYFGGQETPGFTIEDLELLHHYTTSACLTISTEPLTRNFWRVNIPQIGFGTPYILRAILAVSALHLARFRPDRREYYIAQAFLHHNAALAMVSPLIHDINRENCVQLFLFSSITNFFAFAKPREPTDFLLANTHLPDNHAVPDWLSLFRGVRVLMEAEGDTLHSSSIAVMFESGIQMHEFWLAHQFENEATRELEANICNSLGQDSEMCHVLLHTIDALKRSFALVYETSQMEENRIRAIFVWLYKIQVSYINLVADGNNEALCVLAFFCVLLRRLDYLWWVEGWGLHLIERIYSRLDDTYKLWIRWPIEEIGWVPDYSRTPV